MLTFSRVVHHELIHAWQYHEYEVTDHGPTFRQWVEPLETDTLPNRVARHRVVDQSPR